MITTLPPPSKVNPSTSTWKMMISSFPFQAKQRVAYHQETVHCQVFLVLQLQGLLRHLARSDQFLFLDNAQVLCQLELDRHWSDHHCRQWSTPSPPTSLPARLCRRPVQRLLVGPVEARDSGRNVEARCEAAGGAEVGAKHVHCARFPPLVQWHCQYWRVISWRGRLVPFRAFHFTGRSRY